MRTFKSEALLPSFDGGIVDRNLSRGHVNRSIFPFFPDFQKCESVSEMMLYRAIKDYYAARKEDLDNVG